MFERFRHEIAEELAELHKTRKLRRALELSARTGQHFNHNEYPMYFTGKLDASLVLVHLNPKFPNNHADEFQGTVKSFERYFFEHEHFGQVHYGISSPRRHRSPFDHKQIRFVKPFGVINFVDEQEPEDRFTNLERVMEEKLQLELIPYSSDNFRAKGFTSAILRPHLERILDVICACRREYVIFCGTVFETFFKDSIVNQQKFFLSKKDGQTTQYQVRFSNLHFTYKGQVIRAGLAHSFAQQGIPMDAYGEKCRALYHLSVQR